MEIIPQKKLVLTWAEPETPEDISRVTFEIESIENTVCLTVTHGNIKANPETPDKVSKDWPQGLFYPLSLRAPAVAPFRPVLTKLPDAGGIAESSRWLSAATPPDTRPRITCTPEGCQRIHILALPNHGAWDTSEPKPPIRRFIPRKFSTRPGCAGSKS